VHANFSVAHRDLAGRIVGPMKKILIIALASGVFAVARGALSLPAVPRFDGLGRHHHPITTKWGLAQRYFDQGLTLCFNFNHAEAIRSFEAAAMVDTNCAMAWWGVAFACGPNINAPMFDDAVPKAWAALQKAIALKDNASAKERDYIDALAKRYTKEPLTNRAALDAAFADAMRALAKKYPDDLDVQTLFAESLMDTSPWHYWEPDLTPKPAAKEALAVIESVLARVASHSGADHLYIHLVEAGSNPWKGEPSADRIGALTPKAGHLVHMASHIYVRVGRYHDAVTVNERATAVDENYLKKVKPAPGMYPGGYYPHNVHFLWYANDLEGRSKESIAAAKKISEYTTDLRCGAMEGARQRYLPLLAYSRFGRWGEILQEKLPAEEFPFDRAMAHYARGLAFAAQGDVKEARDELAALKKLRGSETVKAMDNPYFPGTKILAVAEPMLAGKIAGATGKNDEFVAQMRDAVKAERELSYMEPPYWHYAAKLSLGAALLKAKQPVEAEKVFRETLKDLPQNGWPLFGLEQSLRAQGRRTEAKAVAQEFRKAWKHADTRLDLSWF
jgi:tetratricopeptide (TPR) repeat protein